MATNDNVAAAFAGESQANRKYLAFAKRADKDGYPQVAKLFRAAAAAETVHAHMHLRVMGGVKATADNVQAAIEGENYEFTKMYPGFLAEAEKEGNKPAATAFKRALEVEEIHHALYTGALEALKGGRDLPGKAMYVCTVCGNTFVGDVPDICPVCQSKRELIEEVK